VVFWSLVCFSYKDFPAWGAAMQPYQCGPQGPHKHSKAVVVNQFIGV